MTLHFNSRHLESAAESCWLVAHAPSVPHPRHRTIVLKMQLREGRVGRQGTGHLRRTLVTDTVVRKPQLRECRVGLQGTGHLCRTLCADAVVPPRLSNVRVGKRTGQREGPCGKEKGRVIHKGVSPFPTSRADKFKTHKIYGNGTKVRLIKAAQVL